MGFNQADLLRATGFTEGDPVGQTVGAVPTEGSSSVSSTSFKEVSKATGGVDPSQFPDDVTLYGRLVFQASTPVDQESEVRLTLLFPEEETTRPLDELTATIPQGDTFGSIDTGYTELTTTNTQTDPFVADVIEARLKTQTIGDSVKAVNNRNLTLYVNFRLEP